MYLLIYLGWSWETVSLSARFFLYETENWINTLARKCTRIPVAIFGEFIRLLPEFFSSRVVRARHRADRSRVYFSFRADISDGIRRHVFARRIEPRVFADAGEPFPREIQKITTEERDRATGLPVSFYSSPMFRSSAASRHDVTDPISCTPTGIVVCWWILLNQLLLDVCIRYRVSLSLHIFHVMNNLRWNDDGWHG